MYERRIYDLFKHDGKTSLFPFEYKIPDIELPFIVDIQSFDKKTYFLGKGRSSIVFSTA